jgi:hypothetical protein
LALLSCSLAGVIAITGCPGTDGPAGDGDGDGGTGPAEGEVTRDDVFDVDDVLGADQLDGSDAAYAVGEPAQLLGVSREQAQKIRADVEKMLSLLKEAGENGEISTGTTENNRPYAEFTTTTAGLDLKLTVVLVSPNRLRYLLSGRTAGDGATVDAGLDGGAYTDFMTGIFLKVAPKAGGGRMHLNLSALTDLKSEVDLDGSIHLLFANHKADKKARRILYRAIKKRSDPNDLAQSFGADLLRNVGVGGRFRSVAIAEDLLELEGTEALGLRVQWRTGEGGRADAVMAHIAPDPRAILGAAHECWDSDGLRTAYSDTIAANDAENPDEGDTSDCVTLVQEDVSEDAASEDAADTDPEVDEVLSDDAADVTEISEGDAAESDVDAPAEETSSGDAGT